MKVVDKDPTKKAGQFEDLSAVEKYEMDVEDYAKRSGKSNFNSLYICTYITACANMLFDVKVQ